jgi:MOSC domain-containing protein YiiM
MTQIGKECHDRCAIYHQAGDCVMPKEGVFAVVVEGGPVKTGDAVEILEPAVDQGSK